MRGAGWRAWMARFLSVAALLAALLVPPSADAGAAGVVAAAIAASEQDDAGDPASRSDSFGHAGAHCVCQTAIRSARPECVALPTSSAVVHPAQANNPLASRAADPPARPPQA